MFNTVPPHYDVVNRLITWGMDKGWRRQAADECLASRPDRFLDLCCGTGDLALDVASLGPGDTTVIGLDYSRLMLDIAVEKAAPLKKRPAFITGDASCVDF